MNLPPIMRRPLLALALAGCAAALSGCPPMAAGFVLFFSSSEFLDHAKVYHLTEHDAREVWEASLAVLEKESFAPVEQDAEQRAAQATIEGARVSLKVDAWDLNHSRLSIAARKLGIYENGLSDRIYERIRARLDP